MARPVDSYDIIDAKATIWPLPLAIIPGKNTRKVYEENFNGKKRKFANINEQELKNPLNLKTRRKSQKFKEQKPQD